MPVFADHPVTAEWKDDVRQRMQAHQITIPDLARAVGTSYAAIGHVLSGAKTSALVPRIAAALANQSAITRPAKDDARIGEIAALREARDHVSEDIVRLEGVGATVEGRIAEACEHRAKLDLKIRDLRGGDAC